MHVVKSRASRGKVLALLASLSMVAAGVLGVATAPASSAVGVSDPNSPGQSGAHKVTICHRTNSTKNPYVIITVDQDAADGNLGNDKGRGDHYMEHQGPVWDASMPNGGTWGDIIPPIDGVHGGRNWTEAGQAIYNNGCNIPTQKRTVYWCSTDDELKSVEQTSADGGRTWKPAAPADATTNSSLTCNTPESGTVKGGTYTYCAAGVDGHVTWADVAYGPDKTFTTQLAAKAEVDRLEAIEMAKVPAGATTGECVADSGTAKGGTYNYCLDGVDGKVTWADVTYGEDGEFETKEDAEAQVKVLRDAAMENVPDGATEGKCTPDPDPEPVVITFYDDATLSASQDICTVNGTVTVDVKGTGLGESTISQPDAKKVAEGNAQLDLDYNLRMAKAQFPGATEGACAPVETTVVEPAVVEPAVVEPATVNLPAKATVAEAPVKVAVPAKATVPTAVPAGEGPADSGFPTWALVLIVAGAAGAAITGARALKNQ